MDPEPGPQAFQSPEEILPLVYAELRRLAAAKMASQRAGDTLQPTALVHEAWLKLAASEREFAGREHFFRAAAQAMRQILIDRARARKTGKRGDGAPHIDWTQVELAADAEPDTLLCVDEALERLQALEPEKADLVKLRFYAGLTVEETAAVLGVSEATVKRKWTHARALLFEEIEKMRGRDFS